MWICSQLGFFSIVLKQQGEVHLRARLEGDLRNLCQALGWPKSRILRTEGDYRWRIIATPAEAAAAIETLGRSVDYPNFKSRIASLPGQREKLPAYHDLWAGLYAIQTSRDQPASGIRRR